jgi:transcriptional regulator with XRE-family HTH domain
LVGWTIHDLAEKARMHRYIVTNTETGRYGGSAEALAAIRAALEAAGVEFIPENGGGPGMQLRKG